MNEFFHVDTGRINKFEVTDEGYLRVWMTVARTGDLIYRNDDGSIRTEYVSKDVLFDQEHLDSLWGKSITLGHPLEKVDSKNSRVHQRGMTMQGTQLINDRFLGIASVITDDETIKLVKDGDAREISCGYYAPIRRRDDGKYDQVWRRVNHIAIVPKGRAGEDVRIHLDGINKEKEIWRTDALTDEDIESINLEDFRTLDLKSKNQPTRQDQAMTNATDGIQLTIKVDSRESRTLSNLSRADADAINALQDRADSAIAGLAQTEQALATAQEEVKSLKKDEAERQIKLDELTAENQRLTQENEALKKDIENAQDTTKTFEAWQSVLDVVGDAIKLDAKLSPREVRIAGLKVIAPDMKLDGKSDEYVAAAWDLAANNYKKDEADLFGGYTDEVLGYSRQDSSDNGIAKIQSRYEKNHLK